MSAQGLVPAVLDRGKAMEMPAVWELPTAALRVPEFIRWPWDTHSTTQT